MIGLNLYLIQIHLQKHIHVLQLLHSDEYSNGIKYAVNIRTIYSYKSTLLVK